MKVIMQDGTELEPLGISGEPATVQGETRDSLVFDFPASAGLEAINSAFSPENCESIRIVEDGGTEHIHTGYVLRVSLTMTPAESEIGEGRITLIVKGLKNLNQVPSIIKGQVEEILAALEVEA